MECLEIKLTALPRLYLHFRGIASSIRASGSSRLFSLCYGLRSWSSLPAPRWRFREGNAPRSRQGRNSLRAVPQFRKQLERNHPVQVHGAKRRRVPVCGCNLRLLGQSLWHKRQMGRLKLSGVYAQARLRRGVGVDDHAHGSMDRDVRIRRNGRGVS